VERDGATALVSDGTPERAAHAPNHPVFLRDGTLLFTDSGTLDADDGCIFAVAPGGGTIVADTSCRHFPNGIALHPHRDEVYVVESTLPGVSACRVQDRGSLAGRRVVCRFSADVVPDGLAFDDRLRILVSCWAPDAILLVDEAGDARPLVRDPRRMQLNAPANVAFLPGTATAVTTNVGADFLSVFEHDTLGVVPFRPVPA
jgi:sugar lactone lactonase YvrE